MRIFSREGDGETVSPHASTRGSSANVPLDWGTRFRETIDILVTRAWLRRFVLPAFLIVTAAVIFGVAQILAGVTHRSVEREALEGAEQIAATFAAIVLEPEEFQNGRLTREGLEDLSRLSSSSTTIEALRLVDRSGELAYSSNLSDLPATSINLDDVLPVLDGQATSEVTSYEAELFWDEESVDGKPHELVEATVPVGTGKDGKPLAALAIYLPYATVGGDIEEATRSMERVLGGAGVLLYLLLIPLARRASKSLSRAQDPDKALMQRRLARAIKEDHLVLHYQPKVELGGGSVTGVEALVRWQDPKRGLIPPDAFIPAAEETAVIDALTMRVLELACKQRVRWMDEEIDLPVSINISGRNLRNDALPVKFGAILAEWGLQPEDFTLEITEGIVMDDFGTSLAVLERLSAMGFRLSVDDFGKGHSSLVRLDRLPLQELKIDRGFIEGMAAGGQAEIVGAIIAVAHGLGLRVVAEGIEDQHMLDRLRAGGCDEAQGFYICRPVTGDALAAWLSDLSRPRILQAQQGSVADGSSAT